MRILHCTGNLTKFFMCISVYFISNRCKYPFTSTRVTINTGPVPEDWGYKDPRTRGPGNLGPGTQRSSYVALSFYHRNPTCVNVLSSNIRLYRCFPLIQDCYATQLMLFVPDCASFPLNSLLIACKTSLTSSR